MIDKGSIEYTTNAAYAGRRTTDAYSVKCPPYIKGHSTKRMPDEAVYTKSTSARTIEEAKVNKAAIPKKRKLLSRLFKKKRISESTKDLLFNDRDYQRNDKIVTIANKKLN